MLVCPRTLARVIGAAPHVHGHVMITVNTELSYLSWTSNIQALDKAIGQVKEKEVHVKGAAREVTAYARGTTSGALKTASSRCGDHELASALIEADGDEAKMLEAIRTHLPDILSKIIGEDDVKGLRTHIMDKIPSCFVVQDSEEGGVVLSLLVDQMLELREVHTGSKRELAKLKELKADFQAAAAAKAMAEAAARVPLATPAVTEKPATPTSLDEKATPNERAIFSKLKAHDSKLDGIFQQGKVGFGKAEEEYEKAEADRKKRDQERFDDKEAAILKEEEEATKAFAAKKQALKDEKDAVRAKEADKEAITKNMGAMLFDSEIRMRSFTKSVIKDHTVALSDKVDDTFAKGEAELDATFDEGVAAGTEHQKTVASAARGKRFGTKVKYITAKFEPSDAENNPGQIDAVDVPPLPRRSARLPRPPA